MLSSLNPINSAWSHLKNDDGIEKAIPLVPIAFGTLGAYTGAGGRFTDDEGNLDLNFGGNAVLQDPWTGGLIAEKELGDSALERGAGFLVGSTQGINPASYIGLRNIQPFFADLHLGGLSLAHNGNLTNALSLRETLVKEGAIFRTTSDTETVVQLIAKSKREKFVDKLIDALFQIQGGYALVMMTNKKLVGVRDPFGIRPLVVGKLKNSYIFASETCALDIVGAKFIREVDNGEIIIIENEKLKSIKPFPNQKSRPCVFEYIYFARPDSLIKNKCAYEYRKKLGAELANEENLDADLVVPVPDSGVPAALGYAEKAKKKFELGLIRNHYVGRTFIEPTQNIRSLGVKLKLSTTKTLIEKKSIILIDDSLVRGTTCHKIVKMLLENGAKKVHVRIACPEIRYPDFYGVDMPTKEELLAHEKNVDEMSKYIKATSLRFLSIEGLYNALIGEKRNPSYPQFSDHYFTGDYPVKPQDDMNNIKIKQLSLLSGKSNN